MTWYPNWGNGTGGSGGASTPALTAAQAENATDTTEGTLSGQILNEAIDTAIAPTTVMPAFTAGQQNFTLPSTPKNAGSLKFEINGVEYSYPDVTLSNLTVFWANTSFKLDPSTDAVKITYT